MIVRSFVVEGIRYQLEEVVCGKANCNRCPHGPYWRCYWYGDGRQHSRYIGKRLPAGVTQPIDLHRPIAPPPPMTPRAAARLLSISLSHPYERAHARYRTVRMEAIGFHDTSAAQVREIDAAWEVIMKYHGW